MILSFAALHKVIEILTPVSKKAPTLQDALKAICQAEAHQEQKVDDEFDNLVLSAIQPYVRPEEHPVEP